MGKYSPPVQNTQPPIPKGIQTYDLTYGGDDFLYGSSVIWHNINVKTAKGFAKFQSPIVECRFVSTPLVAMLSTLVSLVSLRSGLVQMPLSGDR